MSTTEHSRVRTAVEHRDFEVTGDDRVTHGAVGDHRSGTTYLCPQREDVADGARCRVVTCFHHQNFACTDVVDGLFLCVVPAAVGGEQVLTLWHVAQRPGTSRESLTLAAGMDTVDVHVVETTFA